MSEPLQEIKEDKEERDDDDGDGEGEGNGDGDDASEAKGNQFEVRLVISIAATVRLFRKDAVNMNSTIERKIDIDGYHFQRFFVG